MNLFCRLFGHTWWPVTSAPDTRWNAAKEGHTLPPTIREAQVRHSEVCKRCGEERAAAQHRHDDDRPAILASAAGADEPEDESTP